MSWLVKVTPHAVRLFGGAIRAFWKNGGPVVIATARRVLFRV